jgi:hypothetical protein
VQPDQGALDDRHGSAGVAVGALVWVQPVPGLQVDVAVGVVAGVQHGVGCGPGRGVGAGERGAVPAGPATGPGLAWRGAGVVLAVVADPDHDLRVRAGQFHAQLDRVVAAVEGEQCRFTQLWQPVKGGFDLAGGDDVRVVAHRQPDGVQWGGPRVVAG